MPTNKIVCYLFTAFDKQEKLINFIKYYNEKNNSCFRRRR